MGRWFLCSVIGILLILMVPFAPAGLLPTVTTVNAQPDPENLTLPGRESVLSVSVIPDQTYAEISQGGNVRYTLHGEDHRIEGVGLSAGPVQVQCRATPLEDDTFAWSVTQPGIRQLTSNGDTFETSMTVSTSFRPRPEIFVVDVECVGLGAMGGEVITKFQIGTRVTPYTNMLMRSSGAPPSAKPDQEFTTGFIIDNRGNRDKMFRGEIEAPQGWDIAYPATVWVNAGESKLVQITGKAPNDKLWYRYESGLMSVKYWPDGEEGQAQTRPIPATVNGFYLHPALVPLIVLGILAIGMIFFMVVYARRTVEEQVLGKPIPPWRIPIEREYLDRLEQEDPDEFYIMRYHLMVEEHRSALLWYKHFKHVTRKDRKFERKWLKATEKTSGKTKRLRSRQESLENRMPHRLRAHQVRRRRRLARLRLRALSSQWQEQRKLLKVHKKAVRRIDQIHGAKFKKVQKRHSAEFEKERKKVEKENKKRIKQGEVPLPLPEEHALELAEPYLPEPVEVPLMAMEDSHYAVKAQRISRRSNRRIARRSKKAKRRMRKQGKKREKKATRIKGKIPERPSTHLYDEDEFVSEEDVVVEDDRSLIQRTLNIPNLEERDALRRRKQVYRVRIKEASNRGDKEGLEELKRDWEREKRRIRAREGAGDLPEDGERSAPKAKASKRSARQGGNPGEGSGGRTALLTRRRRQKTDKKEPPDSAPTTEEKKDDPPSS